MSERILTEATAVSKLSIEVTPEELMQAARKLQLEAQKAQPGHRVYLDLVGKVLLEYDPGVTTLQWSRRPAELVQPVTDEQIMEQVRRDEAVNSPSTH